MVIHGVCRSVSGRPPKLEQEKSHPGTKKAPLPLAGKAAERAKNLHSKPSPLLASQDQLKGDENLIQFNLAHVSGKAPGLSISWVPLFRAISSRH